MKGKFWGPVPVNSFLDEFLDVRTPRMPTVRYTKFVDVASQRKEPDMYAPLVRFFFSNLKQVIHSPFSRFLRSSPSVKELLFSTRRIMKTQNPVSC